MVLSNQVTPETLTEIEFEHLVIPANSTSQVLPPNDSEMFYYMQRTFRFVPFLLGLCYAPMLYSLLKFIQQSPALWLFYPYLFLLIITSFINIWTSNRKHKITIQGHKKLVSEYAPLSFPSVDVFLPTCGEDLEILRNTYLNVSRLKWSGQLKIYVLDDATRPEVRDLAESFNLEYLVRSNPGQMKKAGNLRSAFSKTSGDLILVLDADFCVRSDALLNLVPYFDDPKVGIVQSPQFFDVDRKQNWLQRNAGATQDLFYRWIQPSRDVLSSAICVGTNAIYRREALEISGGFFNIEHSEDVHTGVQLAKHGFSLRYVPVILAKGLCPEKLPNFISQQYRWAAGSLSLLSSSQFNADNADRTLNQKFSYFSGFLYYITTAINVWIGPLPAVIMMLCFPSQVKPENYLPMIGILVSQLVLFPLVTNFRHNLTVLRVQTVYSVAHQQALVDIFRNRLSGWVATGNTESKHGATEKVCRNLLIIILGYAGLLAYGSVKLAESSGFAVAWPSMILLGVTIFLYYPVLLDLLEIRQSKSD